MRTLTASMATKVATNLATEPITLIQIDWDSGTAFYADKSLTVGSDSYGGSVIQLSEIITSGKHDTLGSVGSVQVTLDDSDGALKAILDADLMEGREIRIYQYYAGLADSDKLLLLQGRVTGPISWSEGTRTITFVAETLVNDSKIGFAPTKTDLPNLHDDAVDVPWPMCFGSPLRVPAVQIYKALEGRTRDPETYVDSDTIYVEDGDAFPQGTPITIGIFMPRSLYVYFGIRDEAIVWFTGSFSGKTFTVTGKNVPQSSDYENISFASRIATDEDYANAAVAWIDMTNSPNLVNKMCYVTDGSAAHMVNFCYKQIGSKCWFTMPWKVLNDDTLYTLPNAGAGFTEIDEVVVDPRTSWSATYHHAVINDNGIGQAWSFITKDGWYIPAGSRVIYLGGEVPTYVANLYASSSIAEVMAYRTVDGERKLVPVPSSYYTINLSDSLVGYTPTTITFETQLSHRENEGWSDEIFVSLTSTQGNNSADAIKHILDTYSTLGTDATSFASVAADLTNYIANFAILDQPDTMSVCEDIAWQSRCALLVKNGDVYITYLSKEVSATDTFSASSITLKTFEGTFTETDDIVTRLKGDWRQQYTDEESTYQYEDNIDDFGLIEESRSIWIYNIEQLVKYTVGFWGYRYSNSWRMFNLQTAYSHLKTETFDTVAINYAQFGGNTIRGFVEDSGVDTGNIVLSYKVLLASLAGAYDTAGPIEEDNFWKGDPNNEVLPSNPAPTDPITGRSTIDYEIDLPDETQFGSEDNPVQQYKIILTAPEGVKRATNFTLEAELQDQYGNRVYSNEPVTINLASTDAADSLSTNTITLSNGYVAATIQITGGTGEDQGTIIPDCESANVPYSCSFTIDGAAKPRFEIYPSLVVRNSLFAVKIVDGPPNTSITVTLNSNDSTGDTLKNDSDVTINSVTLDANGEYTGNWKLTGGTDETTTASIDLAYLTWTYTGTVFQVIAVEAGEAALITTETVSSTAGWSAGQILLLNSGTWELFDIDDYTNEKQVGILYEVVDATSIKVLRQGVADWGSASTADYFVDFTSPGAYTSTPNKNLKIFAYSIKDSKIIFNWRPVSLLAMMLTSPGDLSVGSEAGSYSVDLCLARSSGGQVPSGDYSGLLAGRGNTVSGDYSTILGGYSNTINTSSGTSEYSAILGGVTNTITNSSRSIILGGGSGGQTIVSSDASGILCGDQHDVLNNSMDSCIIGGYGDTIRKASYGGIIASFYCTLGLESDLDSGTCYYGFIAGAAYSTVYNDGSNVLSYLDSCGILSSQYCSIEITGSSLVELESCGIFCSSNCDINVSDGTGENCTILGSYNCEVTNASGYGFGRNVILGSIGSDLIGFGGSLSLISATHCFIDTNNANYVTNCAIIASEDCSITGSGVDTEASEHTCILAGYNIDVTGYNTGCLISGKLIDMDDCSDTFVFAAPSVSVSFSGCDNLVYFGFANSSITSRSNLVLIDTKLEVTGVLDLTSASSELRINGTKVVDSQQSAIANITVTGSNTDGSARSKINAILAALRAHGLIAT